MAEETITRLIDDVDGGEATQKVLVGLNGEWRALDLNDKNHQALMKAIDRFWTAGAPVRGAATSTTKQRPARSKPGTAADRGYDLGMLREWAAETATPVPARGRIAGTIVDQYQTAVSAGWKPRSG